MTDADRLTASEAHALMTTTEADARRQLDIRSAPLFGVWGVFWVVGYLAVWWSVRGQEPYAGPEPWALAVLGGLGGVALAVTVVTIVRATRGVGGASQRQGMLYGLSWPVAFAAAEVVIVALARAGATDEVVGVAATAVPALVVATIYCVSAALWEEPAFFVAGGALALAAAAGALAGAVTGILLTALAGGVGFLGATVLAARSR